MNSIAKIRFKIEEYLTVILLGTLVLLVFMAAVLRWVGISIVWSVDMAQLLLTWLCFVGADIAYSKSKHMGVDLIKNALPPKMKTVLNIIIHIMFVVFMVGILYYGMRLCRDNYVRKFNALPVSYSCATASAPVGAFLMILTGLGKIVENINVLRGKTVALENSAVTGGPL